MQSAAAVRQPARPPLPGLPPRCDLVEDSRCDPFLRSLGEAPLSFGRDQHDLVLGNVEADVVARDVVEDDQIGPLGRELLARALEPALAAVGGEAYEELAVRTTRA